MFFLYGHHYSDGREAIGIARELHLAATSLRKFHCLNRCSEHFCWRFPGLRIELSWFFSVLFCTSLYFSHPFFSKEITEVSALELSIWISPLSRPKSPGEYAESEQIVSFNRTHTALFTALFDLSKIWSPNAFWISAIGFGWKKMFIGHYFDRSPKCAENER